jgi:Tol biopolymer transport system component
MSAAAVATPLPGSSELTLVEFSMRPFGISLVSTHDPPHAQTTLLAGGFRKVPLPYPILPPSWSPDGSLLAFTATAGKRREGQGTRGRSKIFVIGADASGMRPLPGSDEGLAPVFSPDGHTVAFSKHRERHRPKENGGERIVYKSDSVWLADLGGGAPRQLTPWRNGLSVMPSSFSPDGGTIAASRRIGNGFGDAVTIAVGSGQVAVLARNARDPVYAPNGSEIAYLGGRIARLDKDEGVTTVSLTDLYLMNADGAGGRRLTQTPNAIELWPRWDPSSNRLVYSRDGIHGIWALLGFGNSIIQLDPHSGCSETLFSDPNVAYSGAVWRPGADRAAGPISC